MEIFSYILNYLQAFLIVALLAIGLFYLINIGNRYVEKDRKFKITKKEIYYTIIIGILIFIIYQIYTSAEGLLTLISPVFYAIALAYVLNPLVNILENKGVKRLLAVLLVYLMIIGIIVILYIAIIPKITTEFKKLVDLLPTYFNQLYNFFNDLYIQYLENIDNLPSEFQNIKNIIKDNLSTIQNAIFKTLENLTNGIIGLFSKVFSIVLVPILAFYFVKDKEFFKKKIILTIPKSYRKDILRVSREIDAVLGKFIRGQLIVAAFVGIATTIGLFILDVDFALTIGIIAGISNVIPYFGPIIGGIPAVFFALLDEPIKVLWVVILFTAIQQFEGNILSPKIVGESVGLHPVIVIFALLIGGTYFGIIGMLLAVPIAAVLRIVSAFLLEKLTAL